MVALLPQQHGDITAVDFSPDSRRVVTASKDGTAQLWFIQEAQAVLLTGHDSWLWQARFSPDGKKIVTASLDRTVRIWDGLTGELLQILTGHRGTISAGFTPGILDARFSPNGEVVATVGDDGTARIWDPVKGSILSMMIGHDDVVFSATFSDDGQQLLTTSSDRTARLWETDTGRAIQVYTGIDYTGIQQRYDEGNFNATLFAPDGKHVLVLSTEGRLIVLELGNDAASDASFEDISLEELILLAENKVTRGLSCQERQDFLHETRECP